MAESSFGSLLQVGDGAGPEVFTTIGEVRDISGPEYGADTVETTNHSSPGGWEEHIATILRSGEVTFEVNYDPTMATHNVATGIKGDLVDRALRNFKLVRADAGTTTDTFAAFVTGFKESHPVNGKITANITLKLTGEPTMDA